MNGRPITVKKFLQCATIGYKRKDNFVLRMVGGYLGPYLERNDRRLDGQWDTSADGGQAAATIDFQVQSPTMGVSASLPVHQKDTFDGSRWITEYWTLDRHEPYSGNIVHGWWEGTSDRFQGNVALGMWWYKQSSTYPKTPESADDDPNETHEGFYFVQYVTWRCSTIFGIGC